MEQRLYSFWHFTSNKVFSTLNEKGIGYVIINDEIINIKGEIEIYNLYLQLANINYKKFKMKETLHKLLDEVLNKLKGADIDVKSGNK